ncbi:MAG: FAD-dependent thymidylate synthase [Patescibacteria group bacterium]
MKGKAEILAFTKGQTHPEVLEMIELAGRTCYKSADKITPGSAEKFIQTILRSGHESVIEHSWFVVMFGKCGSSQEQNYCDYFLNILTKNGLFSLTEKADRFILSGNARMFRDYFRAQGKTSMSAKIGMDGDLATLLLKTPALFTDLDLNPNPNRYYGNRNQIKISPEIDFTREEKLAHFWAMARFTGCSRAFTHQLVRHRITAISQESQRYCDESGFFENGYFVVPPSFEEAGLADWFISKMKEIDGWYRKAQEFQTSDGRRLVKNEDARFLLPNAVCSEIVMSANLKEWRWILKMRCDVHAQWEIRQMAMDLLREFQSLFPDCFDDFAISDDGKSAKFVK